MIYETVEACLKALETQWIDLGRTFGELALVVADLDSNVKVTVGKLQVMCNSPQSNGNLGGEAQRIAAELAGIRTINQANLLVPQAMAVLNASEQRRLQISTILDYTLNLPDSTELKTCQRILEQLSNFITQRMQDFEEITTIQGERQNLRGLRGAMENLSAYPVLTSNLETGGTEGLPFAARSEGASIQRTLDGAFRSVLGRLPRTVDPRSFVAALNQAFDLVERQGHVEFTWMAPTYAGQTDLGGTVTGRQASLYARARQALAAALPLLDNLQSLKPDFDPEEAEASEAIIRSSLTQLVDEFGMEGGPRVSRVNGLFNILLTGPGTGAPLGELDRLAQLLGLDDDGLVNTLEEEARRANFILLKDHITTLYSSWTQFLASGGARDLGARLILLSRALSVVAESVEEVYSAMDSVFVGPGERQVAAFTSRTGERVLVADLLSWVTSFATTEAPQYVQQGGRRGAASIIPITGELINLVGDLIDSIAVNPQLPPGLQHPRVLTTLKELRTYLRQVQDNAYSVYNPSTLVRAS